MAHIQTNPPGFAWFLPAQGALPELVVLLSPLLTFHVSPSPPVADAAPVTAQYSELSAR